jgi:hypothetical protein
MKFRIIALILALSVLSWTQTTSQPAPDATPSQNAPAADTKAGCDCCQKTASSGDKEAAACCQNMKDGKCDMAACKDKDKDGMACMKGDKTNGAAKACAEGKCCGGEHHGKSRHHDHETTAMNCCGDQCDRKSHSHAGAAK